MNNKELLQGAIQDGFEKLKDMDPASDEYTKMVESLTKLVDRDTEINKNESELQEKIEVRKDNKVDQWIKNGLTAAGVLIPSGVTIWAVLKSLKIEFKDNDIVTGTVGKEMFRKAMNLIKK